MFHASSYNWRKSVKKCKIYSLKNQLFKKPFSIFIMEVQSNRTKEWLSAEDACLEGEKRKKDEKGKK